MTTFAIKRRGLTAVAFILIGIGIGATLLSLDSSQSASPPETGELAEAPQTPVAPISAVEPAQRDAFGLLRSPSEEPPAAVTEMLGAMSKAHGLNFALAQNATPSGFANATWVIPGEDWLCVFEQVPGGGASSCDTTEGATANGIDLAIGSSAAEGQESVLQSTIGIVPDDVEAVQFKNNANGPEAASLEGNVFAVSGGSSVPPAFVRTGN